MFWCSSVIHSTGEVTGLKHADTVASEHSLESGRALDISKQCISLPLSCSSLLAGPPYGSGAILNNHCENVVIILWNNISLRYKNTYFRKLFAQYSFLELCIREAGVRDDYRLSSYVVYQQKSKRKGTFAISRTRVW